MAGVVFILVVGIGVAFYAGYRHAILDVVIGDYDIEAEKEKYYDSKK